MAGPGDTPSRRRIFVCQPVSASDETACARQIMSTISRRAFRRPVQDAELTTLMNFYQHGRKGADFETGIQEAIARMRRTLEMTVIEGIKTSIPLHLKILADPDFVAGRLSTSFMEQFLARRPRPNLAEAV